MCRLRGARVCRLRGACVCICARGTRCKYCRGAVYALSLRRTRAVSCIDVAGVSVRRKRMRKDSRRIVARCRYSVLEVPFLGPIYNLFVLRFASRTTARRSSHSRGARGSPTALLDSTRAGVRARVVDQVPVGRACKTASIIYRWRQRRK